MPEIVLQAEHLDYTYPNGRAAVIDVCFSVERGRKIFFHGANGAGKTTLFQCLAGLLKPKGGSVRIDGQVVKKESERMRRMSLVFQNADDQIVSGSVFDEIAFGPLNERLPHEEIVRRVERAMQIMNVTHLRDKPPHFLSYGEKKRVCIASILSMNREIIILDEPTAGLDAKQREELVGILNDLTDQGKTLLIATHDTDFSFRLADHVIVLDGGALLCEGTAEDVFSRTDVLDRAGLVPPVMMSVYKMLRDHSLIPATTIPKCVDDLSKLLEDNHEQ